MSQFSDDVAPLLKKGFALVVYYDVPPDGVTPPRFAARILNTRHLSIHSGPQRTSTDPGEALKSLLQLVTESPDLLKV